MNLFLPLREDVAVEQVHSPPCYGTGFHLTRLGYYATTICTNGAYYSIWTQECIGKMSKHIPTFLFH